MRVLFTVFAVLLFLSCKNNPGFNGDHLEPKMMQKVLLDISLAEGYSNILKDSLHKPGQKNYDSLTVYYKEIFNHYKITEDQFKQSLSWYKNHPSDLDSLYNNMLPIVTKWQTSQNVPQTPKPVTPN